MATRDNISKDASILMARQRWWEAQDSFRAAWEWIVHEHSLRLIIYLAVAVLILAMLTFYVESQAIKHKDTTSIDSLGKALYWMVITGTTTGYGDITPKTPVGRSLAVLMIFMAMVLTSIFTATIASLLVEKRILEGRGMEQVTYKNHLAIFGWNNNASKILEHIFKDTATRTEVVLVNDLPEQDINEILYSYRRKELKFVRGDFVHENVQERANLAFAKMVLVLADGSINTGFAHADERTILAALAIKTLNPQIKVCAELIDASNAPHLRRANVDMIVVLGEYNDFLLSSAVLSPGVTLAAKELLSRDAGSMLQQVPIPGSLIDKDFSELSRHFREKKGAIVIGVVSAEKRGVTLDDILSEDLSAVDMFIKKQFEGREDDYFFKGSKLQVHINPDDGYKIRKGDEALLIAGPERTKA